MARRASLAAGWARGMLLLAAVSCGGTADPSAASVASLVAPSAARAEPRLIAVDVFDTDPSSVERVVAAHGATLRSILSDDVVVDLAALLAEIRVLGPYAYVEPALVTYGDGRGGAQYLTIDLVLERDATRRMPFREAPVGEHADPGGLIATWEAFATRGRDVAGAVGGALEPGSCPAYHCLVDHSHPDLAADARRLVEGVPVHVEALSEILRDDARDHHRAAAAYLLAYSSDGPQLVEWLVVAFRDPSPLVRNNAMRVVAMLASRHPEVPVPIEPVLEALSFPATTDRNKAAAILDALLSRPDGASIRHLVTTSAGQTLLAMLQLQQPNNHDYAYSILKELSGEAFDERDIEAWRAWIAAASSGPP